MSSISMIKLLERNQFHPVIPFTSSDKFLSLDFTEANQSLATVVNDKDIFPLYIENKIAEAGATYGIGGYGEHRTIYSISPVFDGKGNDEPRRLHLGTDIWGKKGTEIMAPMDGTVHSFAFNNRFGDYGVTIILQHILGGISFYTLYGHLDLASIDRMHAGDKIYKGDVFAHLGGPEENGGWPPHLHLQIITDMEGWHGDYPGVCAYSERDSWIANSPDPELILQLEPYIIKSTSLHLH